MYKSVANSPELSQQLTANTTCCSRAELYYLDSAQPLTQLDSDPMLLLSPLLYDLGYVQSVRSELYMTYGHLTQHGLTADSLSTSMKEGTVHLSVL